jgi:hypothetical protein
MLITATTAILFFVIALASIALGHYIKRIELYAFGVLLMFLFSGFVWYNGISEQTGQVLVADNNTSTTVFTYEQNRDLWVDFLSVGGMLLGVFLAINTYQEFTTERQRKREEDIDAK